MANFRRSIKHAYQKLTRGFSDVDTWSLDATIAQFITPRLKRFRQLNDGYPPTLTEKKWDEMLDSMIETFEFLGSEDRYDNVDKERWKKVDHDLENFGKYFNHLWW